jgi:hypothetical protein
MMATVTPLPFALALLAALVGFSIWIWFLIGESRRPYHWPEPRVIVERPPARPHVRVVHAGEDVDPARRVGSARLAVVVATFLLWSLWSTGRPDRVDPHH